jgi:hypothetical protein
LTQVSAGVITLDVEGAAVQLPIAGIHKARVAPDF